MASIKERKDKDGKTRYYVQIRLKGHNPQYAAFTRLTDAKKWVQDTESDMRAGRHFKTSEAKRHTLGEAIDRYIASVLPTKKKVASRQRVQLLWWKDQIGCKLLSDVTPSLLCEQRDKLLKDETHLKKLRSNATVVRYLAALSHLFTIAIKEWGWLEESPMRKVTKPKEPRGRVRYLADDERKKLLEACKASHNPFLYPAVIISLSTGMRQGELLQLRWSNIDLEKGRIILHETKNGERRVVPLAGLALQLVKEMDQRRAIVTDLLFPGTDPQKPVDLRYAWEKVLNDACIKNFRWHDLRHSTASYLAMNNVSLTVIGEILGHKTVAMVKRYSHLSETHTASVVASMNEMIFG